MTELTWIPSATCDENGAYTDDFYSVPPSAPVENGCVIAHSCFAPVTDDWSIQNTPAQPVLNSSPDVFLPLPESAAVQGPHLFDVYRDVASHFEPTYLNSANGPTLQALACVIPNTQPPTDLYRVGIPDAPDTPAIPGHLQTSGVIGDVTLRHETSRCVLCISRHLKVTHTRTRTENHANAYQCEMVGNACQRCIRSRALCVRFLFSDEPIFKKCKHSGDV